MKDEKLVQNLVLLGLLFEKQRHGYEIKNILKEIITPFTGINFDSIYYPLEKLKKQGFLKKEVKIQKRRPSKYLYKITPEGKKEFKKLLIRNSLLLKNPFFNIDLSLYFIKYLEKNTLERILVSRINGLKKIKQWLKKHLKSNEEFSTKLKVINIHTLKMINLEIRFLKELLKG